MSPGYPCAEQPCLHRVLATCPHDQVVKLAGLYGLLTAIGKVARAGDLPPEPVETWHREIRALRNATALLGCNRREGRCRLAPGATSASGG